MRRIITSRTACISSKNESVFKKSAYNLYNASTGEIRAQVIPSTQEQAIHAIENAYMAQQQWILDFNSLDRSHILMRVYEKVKERCQELAYLETCETGRCIGETTSYDLPHVLDVLQFYASLACTNLVQEGRYMSHSSSGNRTPSWGYTKREPIGLTVGIGSWNYPLVNAVTKSAAALAFGNSMVYKPSEMTPSSALELRNIYHDCGLPTDIFQVVLGSEDDPPTIGTILTTHPHVGLISFTGSTTVGRIVYEHAARSFKKVSLELGGKSPLIIFGDADVDNAISIAMSANWYSSGQVCSNGTRVFVHESLYEPFVEGLVQRTSSLQIGNPLNPASDIGPMISKKHMERVLQDIEYGKTVDKASLIYGGTRLENTSGYYLTPAIFVDCQDTMRIVQDEIFGMVMTIHIFKDTEEVIHRANNSTFGLAAGIVTKDIQRAQLVASRIKVGFVWINSYNIAPVIYPWGGIKNSGLGKENGLDCIETWTSAKAVYVE